MYELDEFGRLHAKIENYNSKQVNLAKDRLVAERFTYIDNLEEKENELPYMVVLVNELFGANVNVDVADQIINDLKENWDNPIFRQLEQLNENDLLHNYTEIHRIAGEIFEIIFQTNNKPYSFTTKFLHWCNPSCLPIVDSHARRAIFYMQSPEAWEERYNSANDEGINVNALQEPNPIDLEDDTEIVESYKLGNRLEDYKKWICFYSKVLQNNPEELENLVQHEYVNNIQPENLHNPNSKLRVLDKYFYQIGKEWKPLDKYR